MTKLPASHILPVAVDDGAGHKLQPLQTVERLTEPARTTVRDAIARRVSCRAYQHKPVPEVQVMLAAA